MRYKNNLELLNSLNDAWQNYVRRNRLAFLVDIGEDGLYLLKHFRFEKPSYQGIPYPPYKTDFLISCEYIGEKEIKNARQFQLCYYVTPYHESWGIASGSLDGKVYLAGYFSELNINQAQSLKIGNALTAFDFKGWDINNQLEMNQHQTEK